MNDNMGSWQSKYVSEQNNSNESDEECFHDAVEIDESNTKEGDVQNILENFQTDAVKSRRPNILNPDITHETLRDIESELSFYEKVSLAFLMFDQVDIALQFLMIEKDSIIQQTTTNLLVKWAQSESSWKNKIIESLCIIQNYSILERLGYNKEDMKSLYLPNSPYTAININILNKALYCFAESMTTNQLRLFSKFLEKDFQYKGLQFIQFDDVLVEMYLLQCFSVKYIKNNNISNLIKILKKMDLNQQIEMLETVLRTSAPRSNTTCEIQDEHITTKKDICPAGQTNNANDCVFDLNVTFNNNSNQNTVTSGNCSQHSVISRSSLVRTYPSGSIYEIDPNNMGICLIINQYTFYVDKNDPNLILAPSTPLENRDGTEFDRDKLKETFKKYNFRVMIKENLTDSEIKNAIRSEMSRFTLKDSCIIVCILSHGEQDSVFGVNSIPVNIADIEDILHDTQYSALLGKPKILIIQSCQGKPLQQVVSVEHNYVTDGVSSNNPSVPLNEIEKNCHGVPQKRDLLLLMSTVSGFASVRDPSKGTWFIQELCDVIEDESDENHFEDIMTTVIGKVSNKVWPKDKKILTMVPQKKSTFSKKLFLTKVQQ